MQVAKKGKRWGLPDDKPCARSVFRLAVDVQWRLYFAIRASSFCVLVHPPFHLWRLEVQVNECKYRLAIDRRIECKALARYKPLSYVDLPMGLSEKVRRLYFLRRSMAGLLGFQEVRSDSFTTSQFGLVAELATTVEPRPE